MANGWTQWFICWYITARSRHGLVWRHSVARLIFMTSFIIYGIGTLTIDGVTTFLQLLDVQNVRKNARFSLKKCCGKFLQSVHDGGIVIDYEGSFILFSFCVLESKWIRTGSDFLLNKALSVGQSLVDKSFALRAHDLFTLTTDLQSVIY